MTTRQRALPPEPWQPNVKAPRVWLLVSRVHAEQLAAGLVPAAVRAQARIAALNFTDWVAQCRAPKDRPSRRTKD